jgi:hypothetical protein
MRNDDAMISSQTTYVKAIHVPDVDGIDQTNLTKKLSWGDGLALASVRIGPNATTAPG